MIGLFSLFKVTDLEVETRIRLPKENRLGAGLVCSYVDDRNYVRVFLDRTAGVVRVSRFVDGNETVVAERPAKIVADEWLDFEFELKDGEIEVNFQDDQVEFSSMLTGPLAKAPAGFFVAENSTADFGGFVIKDEGKR